jgi:hypothetical protein
MVRAWLDDVLKGCRRVPGVTLMSRDGDGSTLKIEADGIGDLRG